MEMPDDLGSGGSSAINDFQVVQGCLASKMSLLKKAGRSTRKSKRGQFSQPNFGNLVAEEMGKTAPREKATGARSRGEIQSQSGSGGDS